MALHVGLGRMPYGEALELQRRTHACRVAGLIPDVLLTVEHDPVFTRGRATREESFRMSSDDVRRAGIAVCDVERGGDVTYHGPGQLVVYPILDLRGFGRDLRGHVRRLEEAAIQTLLRFGIEAGRREGLPGVWCEKGKLASVGVAVRHWVSLHGLALNVAVNGMHFAMIHPCGLPVRAASMNELLPYPVVLADVEKEFVATYGALLGVDWTETAIRRLWEVAHA